VTIVNTEPWGANIDNGASVRVNPNWEVQNWSDHHLLIVDPPDNVEVDCWLTKDVAGYQTQQQSGDPNNGTETLAQLHPYIADGHLTCGWSGIYTLGTEALRGTYPGEVNAPGQIGIHFGPAAGTGMILPSELLAGAGGIKHSIWLNMNCLQNDSTGHNLYPADNSSNTDAACSGSNTAPGTSPPVYGQALLYIGQTDAQIASSSRSTPCKAVLTAAHDYGMFFTDTGDDGTIEDTNDEDAYANTNEDSGPDLWPAVRVALTQGTGPDGSADGIGTSTSATWKGCFNGLGASSFELIQLTHP
jgi:hypothetical protein